MSLQQFSGRGFWWPRMENTAIAPSLSSLLLIDATGEKAAMCGKVWFPSRTGSKNISRVQFRFGTIVKAGGSALTVSLQDVDLATGPPMQPDGTQDQTVAIANADASFATSTWYRTGTFSSSRTVSYGDYLAVVWEFDGAGRLGSDSVPIASMGCITTAYNYLNSCSVLFSSSAWAVQAVIPAVLLEFDDGTFGTLDGAVPASAVNTHTFNLNTAGSDEYALVLNNPFPCKVDGIYFPLTVASGADFEVLLYSGTTALATVTVDSNAIAAASARIVEVPIPETTLSANTDYYVAIRPTTTNNVSVYSFDVNNANHMTLFDGGSTITFRTRVDQGAWAAATTTRRLMCGVRISALDDGVSAGGLLTHPGMSGGMRA